MSRLAHISFAIGVMAISPAVGGSLRAECVVVKGPWKIARDISFDVRRDGDWLRGVTVQLQAGHNAKVVAESKTDENGRTSFSGLPAGSFKLVIPSLWSASVEVVARGGQEKGFIMVPDTPRPPPPTIPVELRAVSGFVRDIAGRPISGATVEVKRGSEVVATAKTDEIGNVALAVPDGEYTMRVHYLGFHDAMVPIRVRESAKPAEFTLKLVVSVECSEGSGSYSFSVDRD